MNDETPAKGKWSRPRLRTARRPEVPERVESAWFAVEQRVLWPLQDRFARLGTRERRAMIGGAAVLVALVVLAVVALSFGGGSSQTTVSEAAAPIQPPAESTPAPTPPKPKNEPPRETLHGAAPDFSPPSSAGRGGEKSGISNSKTAETASASQPTSSSPAEATISSNPSKSTAGTAKTAEAGATSSAAADQAAVPDGPPAGPAALEVAREFAKGFVVYETGGANSAVFRDAFRASATPELAKALLERPPKQPAGAKVPRARVLNVVAGPSQGTVYRVSVALLRVGVTSELRLEMEKLKSGKHAEWRVTNVLG